MSKAVIADIKPLGQDLNEGETRFWCRCGQSKNQPFCDGSHAGTEFTPIKFVAEKTGTSYLCMCKQTGNPPFCDGSHNKLKRQ
jgi:CDGSH-type Zn-finger protein